eukprot:c14074_g1_i1.p1 GENE.c14074_g1_i1~~c14074_g1_i1.p1  ORF type:complete len:488 (-),score=66.72 c14074_g1_i1:50-1513(-)
MSASSSSCDGGIPYSPRRRRRAPTNNSASDSGFDGQAFRPAPDVSATSTTSGDGMRSKMGAAGKQSSLWIDPSDILDKTLVGKGSFGKVYKATWLSRDVAVKVPKVAEQEVIDDLLAEVRMLARLRHRNVIRIYGIADMTTPAQHLRRIGVILEYCPGDLSSVEVRERVDPVKTALGIAAGLAYLHSANIIHRDLKPANILLDRHDEPKIIDFGFARAVPRDLSEMTIGTGSVNYMAPEAMTREQTERKPYRPYKVDSDASTSSDSSAPSSFEESGGYGLSADVFSFGRLLADIADVNAACTPAYKRLIRRCTEREPTRRPTAAELERLLARFEDADYPAVELALEERMSPKVEGHRASPRGSRTSLDSSHNDRLSRMLGLGLPIKRSGRVTSAQLPRKRQGSSDDSSSSAPRASSASRGGPRASSSSRGAPASPKKATSNRNSVILEMPPAPKGKFLPSRSSNDLTALLPVPAKSTSRHRRQHSGA